MDNPFGVLFFMVFMLNLLTMKNADFTGNFDKIIYYDQHGNVIDEYRVLNITHPHSYQSIKNQNNKVVSLNGKDYPLLESSIEYIQRAFGTVHVTHLKLQFIG